MMDNALIISQVVTSSVYSVIKSVYTNFVPEFSSSEW